MEYSTTARSSSRIEAMILLSSSGSLPRFFFFFNDTATTEIYTLSLHDALPICQDLPLALGQLRHVAPADERRSGGSDHCGVGGGRREGGKDFVCDIGMQAGREGGNQAEGACREPTGGTGVYCRPIGSLGDRAHR